MRSFRSPRAPITSAALAALALAVTLPVACDGAVEPGRDRAAALTAPRVTRSAHESHGAAPQSTAPLGPEVLASLGALRAATARFHSLDAAQAAGYDTRVTDCMSDPTAGGMGVHYADLDRFDATVDATRPEILVYEPGPHGRPRLVAVEYAVPLTAWREADPPTLYGIPFHVNAAFGLWVLHAWVWAPNPSGMFADWNPRIACPAS